jgi:hypothetical protein
VSELDINSKAYWERRFKDDWDGNLGREQSRFFAALAVKAMPNWLVVAIRTNAWSLCDWGCAEGDGTQVLAETFPGSAVTGIDFSQAAIVAAKERYGGSYVAEDWLASGVTEDIDASGGCWDLVFSSNTLEHFAEPDMVLPKLCDRATKCVVLLVPYRELERHPEHAVTFTPGNIRFVPHPEFALCYGAVVDAALEEPSYWGGEQVLLIYCRLEQAAALGLSAQETVVCLSEPTEAEGSQEGASGQAVLVAEKLQKRVHQLREALKRRDDFAEDLAKEVRRQYARNLELAKEVRRQDASNQELAEALRRESGKAQRCAEEYTEIEREIKKIRRNPFRLLMRCRRGAE